GRRDFAASDLARALGVSVRTINRRLQSLENAGWIESRGNGRAQKHRLR
ncbi:helix-turn-helix domain-containing protein, partial [Escherichia coli]